jgi:sec-independent protein translocase protein TatC
MTQSEKEKNQDTPSVTGAGSVKGTAGEITHDPLPVVPPRANHMPAENAEITEETPAIIGDDEEGQDGIIGQGEDDPGQVMTVIEHLDELRTRILRALGAFVLTMAIALWFGKDVIVWLEQPAGAMRFQALSLEEPLIVYFKVAFYVAIVLASPFLLGEFAGFVWPGLKKKEKQVLLPIIVGGPLLFVAGALFAYYLALPPMLYFFNSFGQAMTPINQRLDYYISLVLTIMMYMGLCFQLPILLFCLSFAGIVNSRQLLGFWRYAILVSAMVAAIVTPDPTVISMLIVMMALVGLYFGSVLLLKVFGK